MVGFCDYGNGSPCSVVTENVLISRVNITSEVTPYSDITDLTPCTLYIIHSLIYLHSFNPYKVRQPIGYGTSHISKAI